MKLDYKINANSKHYIILIDNSNSMQKDSPLKNNLNKFEYVCKSITSLIKQRSEKKINENNHSPDFYTIILMGQNSQYFPLNVKKQNNSGKTKIENLNIPLIRVTNKIIEVSYNIKNVDKLEIFSRKNLVDFNSVLNYFE